MRAKNQRGQSVLLHNGKTKKDTIPFLYGLKPLSVVVQNDYYAG
jgi:hypothetical protein